MESLGNSNMGDPVDVPDDTFISEQRQPGAWEKAEFWPSRQEARKGELEFERSLRANQENARSWTC